MAALVLLAAEPEIARVPLELRTPVQDKNFLILSVAERSLDLRPPVEYDPELAGLAEAKRAALQQAVANCSSDNVCYVKALMFTPAEIALAAGRLRALYASQERVRRSVDGPVRHTGVFVKYHSQPGGELLAQAWMDAAKALNNIIEVYGLGKAPRYPAADAVAYDVTSPLFKGLVHTIAGVMDEERPRMALFFEPTLNFALHLLEASHRDEAGRFEPLEAGENAAALRRMSGIDWSKFPYPVIVVPGSGADRISFNISGMGQLRCELAARRLRDGAAPFILVSGGFVHPNQTPYAEALEMKRYLGAKLGVPAEAILIEPHARHTTTNLRNAARQIYRYGMPFDKPALITTDAGQSAAIESAAFADRCPKELGYLPGTVRRRLSKFDLEWTPALMSLQADAMDPLDP